MTNAPSFLCICLCGGPPGGHAMRHVYLRRYRLDARRIFHCAILIAYQKENSQVLLSAVITRSDSSMHAFVLYSTGGERKKRKQVEARLGVGLQLQSYISRKGGNGRVLVVLPCVACVRRGRIVESDIKCFCLVVSIQSHPIRPLETETVPMPHTLLL